MYEKITIKAHELGLLFKRDEFVGLLEPGTHGFWNVFGQVRVDRVSQRAPWLEHELLDVIVASGALEGRAEVLDLAAHERAVVWVDGRFGRLLMPGLHALWTGVREVEIERIDARVTRFESKRLGVILDGDGASEALKMLYVPEGMRGVLYVDGKLAELFGPGRYAFWTGVNDVRTATVSIREVTVDVAGQEIMTADKVTLRINAVLAYRVADLERALLVSEDFRQTLYREAQLALRAVVGTRELDALLADKRAVAEELEQALVVQAERLGLTDVRVGIRDLVLPGEMRDLLNRVMEARKSAEAALITRREETAGMRSLANTAKLLEGNPTLMRLKELEVLSGIAEHANLSIVLGEQGLSERVLKLL